MKRHEIILLIGVLVAMTGACFADSEGIFPIWVMMIGGGIAALGLLDSRRAHRQ